MESPEINSLPIILVSAKDQASATNLISEIIDNETNYSSSNQSENKSDCVWKLANKYYTAEVRLHPLADGAELEAELQDLVEGHIIYLAHDEVSGAASAEAMRRRVGAGAGAEVKLVVAECAGEDEAGAADAAARGYALVPLRAPADAEAREPAGPARARAALHAHPWPNMRAAAARLPSPRATDGEDDSDSDSSWSSWQGAEGADGADGADGTEGAGFAAALDALQRGAALRPGAGAPRALRLHHAESVLAALCAALGEPPPL